MKRLIQQLFRACGLELSKFKPDTSNAARLQRLISYHRIDLVLDVGANIGQFATHLRSLGYQGKIVSFEPLAKAHAQLLSASKGDPLWETAPRAAIGSRDGTLTINIANNSDSSSALPMLDLHLASAPESAYISTETVKLYKLDTIAPGYIGSDNQSIFLKIDVQGLETQVLEGATQVLSRISGLQLEMSLAPLYQGEPLFREMLDRLDRLGFELFAVIPSFTDMKSGRLLQMDGIFFRKER